MREQVIKGEDFLLEGLPEGWKVEIRVRKTGKKDRYYTDPEHGYIFRSIKDIDRYLLTGKLGRHVTKTKPKESNSGTANVECDELSDVSQQKELIKPDGMNEVKFQLSDEMKEVKFQLSDEMKEPCLGLEAQGQEIGENTSKRKASTTAHDSKGAAKKKISRPSTAKSSRSPKKKESPRFFMLDSDQCDETDAIDIPNLGEIIDSLRKEKEGHKTVYISAPDIGSLLGGQTSETRAKPNQGHDTKPRFRLPVSQYITNIPNMSYIPTSMLPKQEWGPKNVASPYQSSTTLEKFGRLNSESRPIGVPGCPLFGNLLTDPCIDFAFKTLTGTTPFGNKTSVEDRFSPQQLGSSRMLSQGGPCQS